MKGLPKLALLLLGLLLAGLGAATAQFDNFEDFLMVVEEERVRGSRPTMPGARMKTRMQTRSMRQGPGWDDEDSEAENSGDGLDRQRSRGVNPVWGVGYHPARRVTCCDFGRLAGGGGYHCNPDFYKPQIWFRLRSQFERKMMMMRGNRGRTSGDPDYVLISQFRKCMAGRRMAKNAFHKCCKEAHMESLVADKHHVESMLTRKHHAESVLAQKHHKSHWYT